MVVCKYWKQGNCRNGNSCRFEHPKDFNTSGNNNNNNDNRGGFGGGSFGSLNRPERWQLNEDDMRLDLTATTPKWILSAYGPGKEPPASLFLDNEFSPEEIRWRFYHARTTGNTEQADQEAVNFWQKAQSDIKNAAGKIKAVQEFMAQKEKEHPNRYDYCKMDGSISSEEHAKNAQMNSHVDSSINPFGNTRQPAPAGNPFSQPAFGQSASPFAKPAQLAQSSPFGQPAQPAQPSPFGQPSQPATFGTPAFGQAGFGQPAAPQPAFGKTAFGQPSAPVSAFGGKPMGTAAGFAQTPNLGSAGVANPFGKPSAAGGFGQAGFGQTAAPSSSPFTQAGAAPSGFGQTAGATPSPFGGAPAASASPFSQPAFSQPQPLKSDVPIPVPSQPANPFKTPGFGQTAFGQTAQPSGASAFTRPPPSTGAPPFSQQPQPAGPSPFAQQPQNAKPNPFGPSQSSTPSGFGTGAQPTGPSAFGGSSQPTSSTPFSQPQQSQPQTPYPSAVTHAAGTDRSGLTGKPTRPLHYTQTLPWAPPTFDDQKILTSYRGMPVRRVIKMKAAIGKHVFDTDKFLYTRPDGRGEERIWHPKANAEDMVQKLTNAMLDFQVDDVEYTEEVREQYRKLFEEGRFEQGKIPLVPPMREWIAYDI